MKRNKIYMVHGWIFGTDYDAGKPSDVSVRIAAADESEADKKGEKKINKNHGNVEVILSVEVSTP